MSWEADLVEPGVTFDEDIKRDVLGSRRRILFVEGRSESLDQPLYSLLFPMVSVVAKESCKAVEQTVIGLRAAESLTWVEAWGIVDGDNQTADQIAKLAENSIFSLPLYSVESIYYHPWIMQKVAERLAAVTSKDAQAAFNSAIDAGIGRVRGSLRQMVVKAATRAARDQVLGQLPTGPTVQNGVVVTISVDVPTLVNEREAALVRSLDARDWAAVVARCPIRESGALGPICAAIGFKNTRDYEAAVRTLLAENTDSLSFARSLFAGAADAILVDDASVSVSSN